MMILFYLFSVCIVLQTVFVTWMLWSPGGQTPVRDMNRGQLQESLSIIICARDEAENLHQNLQDILRQNHPDFEVIVVNDASSDDTTSVLQSLQLAHHHLEVVTIGPEEERTLPGKKFALQKGIAVAKHPHLLFCDADCKPASGDWAALMAGALSEQKQIIAGYGAYCKAKGWLNTFIRWETLHTFIQYSTYTRSGLPYMAVGRNLAVHKFVPESAQEHPLWAAMPSGDDDLLVRIMATGKNIGLVSDHRAFTYSKAKENVTDWIAQKQRHLSTGKLYKKHIQFLLSLYGLSHGMMWLLFFILWISGYLYLISSLMLLRCILTWSLWGISAQNMRERGLLLWLPFCDLGWAFYNLFFSPYIFFKSKKQWT